MALHGLAPQASTSALDAAGVLDLPQESTAGSQAATCCAASHDGENSSVSKHRAPCSRPCARSPDLASGPETLSCPCWGHSRGRSGRGIATESGPTPSRQCRTASARTAGPRFSADCSCGCGRVGGLLVRGGRVGWALPYVVGGCWAAQLAQLAQPWAKVPTLGPCMAPLLTCPYTPPHGENPHVSWSRGRYVGTYGSQGYLHGVSPCER